MKEDSHLGRRRSSQYGYRHKRPSSAIFVPSGVGGGDASDEGTLATCDIMQMGRG